MKTYASIASMLLIALLPAATVGAAPKAEEPVVTEHVHALESDLRGQREEIEAHMEDGRYAEISDEDRADVLAQLDVMERLVGSAPDVQSLTPEQRAELLNAQGRVNTLLTQARADGRVVCRRIKVIGTRTRRTTVCHTVAQWDRAAEDSQEKMRLTQHSRVRGPGN